MANRIRYYTNKVPPGISYVLADTLSVAAGYARKDYTEMLCAKHTLRVAAGYARKGYTPLAWVWETRLQRWTHRKARTHQKLRF